MISKWFAPASLLFALFTASPDAGAQAVCDFRPKLGQIALEAGETVQVASIPALSDEQFISALVLTDRRLIAAPHPDVPGPMEAPDDAELFSAPLRSFDRDAILDAAMEREGLLRLRIRFRNGRQTMERDIFMEVCPAQAGSLRELVRQLGSR